MGAFAALLQGQSREPLSDDAFRAMVAQLDGMSLDAQIAASKQLSKAAQRRLFISAKQRALPLVVEDIVPANYPAMKHVICHGYNSLPAFRNFEKQLYRASDGVVYGRNHQTMAVVTGPGYFRVDNQSGGGLAFDYKQLPKERPTLWPDIVDNRKGLSSLVYGGLLDTVYRVSKRVLIGDACKDGKPLDSYFVLVVADA